MKYLCPLLPAALLLLTLPACLEPAPSGEVLWVLQPDLDRVDFGGVLADSVAVMPLTITNSGTGTASILSIAVEGGGGGAFYIEGGWAGNVEPSQSFEQVVLLRSSELGAISSTLVITVRAGADESQTLEIPLRGEIVLEQLRSYPVLLDFGHVPPGSIGERTVTLENLTSSELEVFGWSVSESIGFGLTGPADQTALPWLIPAFSTVQSQITYNSTDEQPRSVELLFQNPSFAALGLGVTLLVNRCEESSDPSWDGDGDGSTPCGGDCDDNDELTYPGAIETLDGSDNDCDGDIDEGTTVSDDDGDGFAELDGDCDDSSDQTFPGAVELEDGQDNNCNGEVDEGTPSVDNDGDGYTTGAVTPDCDDNDSSSHPGAPEIADGKDNDCDGYTDEGTPFYDDDNDGYCDGTVCIPPAIPGDCNDERPSVNPGAPEAPNGVDDDCDGQVDDGTGDVDIDGDGYTVAGGDCDDLDPGIRPGAAEQPNGLDDDCDGLFDENTINSDDDLDGHTEVQGDCNDSDPTINPSAPEDAAAAAPGEGDGIDNNCDGRVDEGTTWADDDGDGFSERGNDCDDSDPTINPGAPDPPGDGVDRNCDGSD